MTDHEVMHIAIAPPANPDANLIGNVATVIERSPYDTRLLLAGQIPKIIAHYNSVQIAESAIQKLRDLGIIAIACRDSELRQLPRSFKAQTLEFREKEAIVRDNAGHEKRIGENNVFLILEGRMQTSVEVETTKSKTKFSVTRTLLTGGIPMWHKVNEKTTERSINIEYFTRLYDQTSPEPSVEILQHHMNYSFLEAKVATSSLSNFGAVILKLREVFPKAIFDDRLAKTATVNTYSSRFKEDIEIYCKLIYLFHTATSNQLSNHQ